MPCHARLTDRKSESALRFLYPIPGKEAVSNGHSDSQVQADLMKHARVVVPKKDGLKKKN
jgi:hypothetical protein